MNCTSHCSASTVFSGCLYIELFMFLDFKKLLAIKRFSSNVEVIDETTFRVSTLMTTTRTLNNEIDFFKNVFFKENNIYSKIKIGFEKIYKFYMYKKDIGPNLRPYNICHINFTEKYYT